MSHIEDDGYLYEDYVGELTLNSNLEMYGCGTEEEYYSKPPDEELDRSSYDDEDEEYIFPQINPEDDDEEEDSWFRSYEDGYESKSQNESMYCEDTEPSSSSVTKEEDDFPWDIPYARAYELVPIGGVQ